MNNSCYEKTQNKDSGFSPIITSKIGDLPESFDD